MRSLVRGVRLVLAQVASVKANIPVERANIGFMLLHLLDGSFNNAQFMRQFRQTIE